MPGAAPPRRLRRLPHRRPARQRSLGRPLLGSGTCHIVATVRGARAEQAAVPSMGIRADVPAEPDPVRARRARIARWTLLANRAGYVLLAIAVALFFVAL